VRFLSALDRVTDDADCRRPSPSMLRLSASARSTWAASGLRATPTPCSTPTLRTSTATTPFPSATS
jgi:hypothetical protein